ncbi:hypothetical protein SO802_030016 [Lithocarpus litseifolius]|uniref:Uncharacterized protein n=1 Tax=Lithocarpus litseifolius TaxID=425828 RepID=A0AAW2BXA5_9ROSI
MPLQCFGTMHSVGYATAVLWHCALSVFALFIYSAVLTFQLQLPIDADEEKLNRRRSSLNEPSPISRNRLHSVTDFVAVFSFRRRFRRDLHHSVAIFIIPSRSSSFRRDLHHPSPIRCRYSSFHRRSSSFRRRHSHSVAVFPFRRRFRRDLHHSVADLSPIFIIPSPVHHAVAVAPFHRRSVALFGSLCPEPFPEVSKKFLKDNKIKLFTF